MLIKCIIVDDEPLAREGLTKYINQIESLELVAECKNAVQANEVLKSQDIHLIFLDIELPIISGIEFLKTLKNPPFVILTTAYSEYAVEGYSLDVLDYLVKPISFDRFLQAVNKVFRRNKQVKTENPNVQTTDLDDYLFINTDKRLVKVKFSEILFIEGMQNYIAIQTKKEKLLTLISMKSILEVLSLNYFIQTHKSYIVSIDKINEIVGNTIRINKYEIPISKRMKEAVVNKIVSKNLLRKNNKN